MNADHGIDVIALPVCWPWELCRKGKVETKQNTGKHLPAAGDHHSQHPGATLPHLQLSPGSKLWGHHFGCNAVMLNFLG